MGKENREKEVRKNSRREIKGGKGKKSKRGDLPNQLFTFLAATLRSWNRAANWLIGCLHDPANV